MNLTTTGFKKHCLGQSVVLERQQRISFEGCGDLFFKNTQTEVRELHRKEDRRHATASKEARLLKTRMEVDALQKKIEHEIGKLKKIRKNFLAENTPKSKNKPNNSVRQPTLMENEPSPKTLQPPKMETSQRKPYFSTMRVKAAPGSTGTNRLPSKPASEGANQAPFRMCGGCIFGFFDSSQVPCTVYQSDFRQCPCTVTDRPGRTPPSEPPNDSDQALVMPSEVAPGKSPALPCYKRKTDLNTNAFASNHRFDPRATPRRTQLSARPTEEHATKPGDTFPSSQIAKSKNGSFSRNPNRSSVNPSSILKKPKKDPIERMVIRSYTVPKQRPGGDLRVDIDKLRMEQQYMEVYKAEQKKTAKKESTLTLSELDICPTYTILPNQNINLLKATPSYLINVASSSSAARNPKDDLQVIHSVTQIVVTPSSKEKAPKARGKKSQGSKRRDKFQICTLSVRRNEVSQSVPDGEAPAPAPASASPPAPPTARSMDVKGKPNTLISPSLRKLSQRGVQTTRNQCLQIAPQTCMASAQTVPNKSEYQQVQTQTNMPAAVRETGTSTPQINLEPRQSTQWAPPQRNFTSNSSKPTTFRGPEASTAPVWVAVRSASSTCTSLIAPPTYEETSSQDPQYQAPRIAIRVKQRSDYETAPWQNTQTIHSTRNTVPWYGLVTNEEYQYDAPPQLTVSLQEEYCSDEDIFCDVLDVQTTEMTLPTIGQNPGYTTHTEHVEIRREIGRDPVAQFNDEFRDVNSSMRDYEPLSKLSKLGEAYSNIGQQGHPLEVPSIQAASRAHPFQPMPNRNSLKGSSTQEGPRDNSFQSMPTRNSLNMQEVPRAHPFQPMPNRNSLKGSSTQEGPRDNSFQPMPDRNSLNMQEMPRAHPFPPMPNRNSLKGSGTQEGPRDNSFQPMPDRNSLNRPSTQKGPRDNSCQPMPDRNSSNKSSTQEVPRDNPFPPMPNRGSNLMANRQEGESDSYFPQTVRQSDDPWPVLSRSTDLESYSLRVPSQQEVTALNPCQTLSTHEPLTHKMTDSFVSQGTSTQTQDTFLVPRREEATEFDSNPSNSIRVLDPLPVTGREAILDPYSSERSSTEIQETFVVPDKQEEVGLDSSQLASVRLYDPPPVSSKQEETGAYTCQCSSTRVHNLLPTPSTQEVQDISQGQGSASELQSCEGIYKKIFSSTPAREKRRGSVTFEDESVASCCCLFDKDLPPMQCDVTCSAQEPLPSNESTHFTDIDDQPDSYRSSSTANTEFTCNESQIEDGCSEHKDFGTESIQDYIPPYTGCPCMLKGYLKLAAKCTPTRVLQAWSDGPI